MPILMKVAIGCLVILTLIVWGVWLVTAPRKLSLAPELRPLDGFHFQTGLKPVKPSDWDGVDVMSRRLSDGAWEGSGPFSDFKTVTASTMGIDYLRVDGIFMIDAIPRVIVGRIRDRGAGMYGWHVTMLKLDSGPVDLSITQRYRVWIEKTPPVAIGDDGTPTSPDPKRWFFTGTADVVADKHDKGVDPNRQGQ